MANKMMANTDESIPAPPFSLYWATPFRAALCTYFAHFTGCVGRILSSAPAVLMALRMSVSACT
ncbi:MAG: hypothetical protein SPE32_02235, partial [Mitsuokella sp.]|nr:hypothetical protein [Mitsuokella sp.]